MSLPTDPTQRITARALVVWLVGVAVYVIAVFARTSLSATGVDAAIRFDASPTILSLFTVLQLAVYAAMQIPAGTVLDRIGARGSIGVGTGLIFFGLIAVAFATSVPTAIFARVLIGAGDAFIFISVLRLAPAWFPTRNVPMITQLTGMAGQLGQILSLGPLVGLMLWQGWTAAFVAAAALTLLTGILALAVIRNGGGRVLLTMPASPVTDNTFHTEDSGDPGDIKPALRESDVVERVAPPLERQRDILLRTWHNPGTRAGFWVHFTAPFSAYAFALLWGFPYMTEAEGLAQNTALGVLSFYVFGGLIFGPLFGVLTSRFATRRTAIVLTLAAAHTTIWSLVLLWPGGAPVPVFYVLALILAAGAPGSLVGFDFSRSTNPPSRMGVATGMVATGGFVSTLLFVFLIGVMLEVQGQSSPELFTSAGFSLAWSVQLPITMLGLIMMVRSSRKYRHFIAAEAGE